MVAVGVMLVGVAVAALAGFGRDQVLRKTEQRSGSFTTGLIMTVVAGICSCGMSLSFVYGQGPIVAAMKAQGAGDLPATFAVWAVGLLGGSAVNIIYPAYLLTKKKSWGVLTTSWRQVFLACIIGVNMAISIVLMGSEAKSLRNGDVQWGDAHLDGEDLQARFPQGRDSPGGGGGVEGVVVVVWSSRCGALYTESRLGSWKVGREDAV